MPNFLLNHVTKGGLWCDIYQPMSFLDCHGQTKPVHIRWIPGSLGFVSIDTAQSMTCAIGRIHFSLKVVVGFKCVTPSHYHHNMVQDFSYSWAHTGKESVNAWWIYSMESVSKMQFYRLFLFINLQYRGLFVYNWTIQVAVIEMTQL